MIHGLDVDTLSIQWMKVAWSIRVAPLLATNKSTPMNSIANAPRLTIVDTSTQRSPR